MVAWCVLTGVCWPVWHAMPGVWVYACVGCGALVRLPVVAVAGR